MFAMHRARARNSLKLFGMFFAHHKNSEMRLESLQQFQHQLHYIHFYNYHLFRLECEKNNNKRKRILQMHITFIYFTMNVFRTKIRK